MTSVSENLQEDLAYTLLKKINESRSNLNDFSLVPLLDSEGKQLTNKDLQDYLVYLNQKGFIDAEFSSEHYPDRDPNQAPGLENVKSLTITTEGHRLLQDIEAGKTKRQDIPIADKDRPFLEKVMIEGKLEDIFDARDLSEVVFRIMRDLMTTEASDRVGAELHKDAVITEDKALQAEIVDLWQDTNPLVSFLSHIRPAWQGPGIFQIDSDRFLFRVANEGGMPSGTNAEIVTKAVFAATKPELTSERIQEIAEFLPGVVRQIWELA
jgi:uncharacterized protein (DUF2267 family)